MPGVLLEQVEQDPLQGRRVGAVPAVAGLADLGQVVGLDDGPAPPGLIAQVIQEAGERLVRTHVPAIAIAVGPRVADVMALEAPLEPAQLDIAQVLDQLERGPAGQQPAAGPFGGGQRLELAGQLGPEVVEVAQEDLGARAGRSRRFGKRFGLGNAEPSSAGSGHYPVMITMCHRPPLRLRLFPLS